MLTSYMAPLRGTYGLYKVAIESRLMLQRVRRPTTKRVMLQHRRDSVAPMIGGVNGSDFRR